MTPATQKLVEAAKQVRSKFGWHEATAENDDLMCEWCRGVASTNPDSVDHKDFCPMTELDAALSALAQEQDVWIDVRESLPLQDKYVLWALKDEPNYSDQVVEGFYEVWQDGKQFWRSIANPSLSRSLTDVTHWREKPSPPGAQVAALPDPEKCGKPVIHFIAREGSFFPCALPKDHGPLHRAAGTCFKHGPYLGMVGQVPQCPEWPNCVQINSVAALPERPKA